MLVLIILLMFVIALELYLAIKYLHEIRKLFVRLNRKRLVRIAVTKNDLTACRGKGKRTKKTPVHET
ncbi:MAG: hypothetical protein VR68_00885 [Peptococcaceae bacterium BRH_c4a]|nr:MAG: hypothetical protein VR68_00885 [Peptococcaceae bacterium BRH_c4a]